MKASGYVPTSFQQKAIDEEHARHKKRIENILTKKNKEHGSATNLKMSQQLQKNMKAAHNEKFQSIDKDNKFLLEKLIEISRKKPIAVAGAGVVVVEKKEHSHSKSLHGTYRKKEMMRISMENEAFAKRLLAQQSTFDRKKVNNDFKKHQALLVQIKRVSTSPQKGPQSKKLPPLTIDVKTPKKENISLIKSPLAKDINSAKEPAASAPSRGEKTSNRLPESTKEVDNKKKIEEVDDKKKTEEVLPEVQSEKAIDEKKPEPEKVEEPKEDIKEAKEEEIQEVKQEVKEVKEEVQELPKEEVQELPKEEVQELPKEEVKETEKVPIAEVEEKPVKSQPDVEAQAEEKMATPVENKPESNSQIGEDLPNEDGEAAKPE